MPETLRLVDEKQLLHGYPSPPLWSTADASPASDMYASEDESSASVLGFYGEVRAFADATITALPLSSPGVVVFAPGRGDPAAGAGAGVG